MRATVDINVCTTSTKPTQLYMRVGILLTSGKHLHTHHFIKREGLSPYNQLTPLLFIDKVIRTVQNILLYKMYPSWCTNCNVSLQGQIPMFILVTCLPCISSDNKNNVKMLSFLYLDSKTVHTYTPRHIDIQEETSIIPSLYVLQLGV